MADTELLNEEILPEGWICTTIGDITLPIEKVQPKYEPQSRFTYLDISSIDTSANTVVSPKTYTGGEAPSRARQLVRANDVLFSTVRPYLKNIALVPETAERQVASTGFAVLRGASGISQKYLFYYTLTDRFIKNIGEYQRGTSYPAVRDSDVRAQAIPLAPTAEQFRIVAEIEKHFSRLDAVETLLRRVRTKLRRYKASVLKAACEGRLVITEAELARAEGRDYDPADKLLNRILAERRAHWEVEQWGKEIEKAKQRAAKAARKSTGRPLKHSGKLATEEWENIAKSEYNKYLPNNDYWKRKYEEPVSPDKQDLPELPVGWCWASIEQLVKSIQYGHTASAIMESVGPKFLRITDIQDGQVNWDTVPYCECSQEEHLKYHLEPGDIVFARTGATTGKSYLITDCPDAVFASYLIRLRLSDLLDIKYLVLLLDSPIYWSQIMNVRKGSAQPGVNATVLATLHIPLPPLAEQKRIARDVDRRISLVAELESMVETSLIRAERLRQSILKRAFEGTLVSQNPTDESAQALLERIHDEKEKVEQQGKQRERREIQQMSAKLRQRRALWGVLVEAKSQLTPEKLFQNAGFDKERTEEFEAFYDELRVEINNGRIRETRPNNTDVYLKAANYETR